MKISENKGYLKRTQKNYLLFFKTSISRRNRARAFDKKPGQTLVYKEAITVTKWLQKHGAFDWEHKSLMTMANTSEQKILELEAKVKLLEKQKARAEHLAERADKTVIIFDMLVNMAEKEYDIEIRKNYKPESSISSKKSKKKQ